MREQRGSLAPPWAVRPCGGSALSVGHPGLVPKAARPDPEHGAKQWLQAGSSCGPTCLVGARPAGVRGLWLLTAHMISFQLHPGDSAAQPGKRRGPWPSWSPSPGVQEAQRSGHGRTQEGLGKARLASWSPSVRLVWASPDWPRQAVVLLLCHQSVGIPGLLPVLLPLCSLLGWEGEGAAQEAHSCPAGPLLRRPGLHHGACKTFPEPLILREIYLHLCHARRVAVTMGPRPALRGHQDLNSSLQAIKMAGTVLH